MIIGIVCFIFSILGIYGFYNDFYILTYIAFILCLIQNIIGRINGSSKTIMPFLISCILGIFVIKNFWLGLVIGACFENAIMFIGGLIVIFYLKNNKKK